MSYIKAFFKGINAYTLPQYLFILLVYYLIFNSINNFIRLKMKITIEFPDDFIGFNEEIFVFIDGWIGIIPLLAISLFISSIVFSLIKENPFFERYDNIRGFASFVGTSIGTWLLLIWGVYWIYGKSQEWFFVVIFIIAFIIPLFKDIFRRYL